jgi:WD40 repeat protein
VVLAAYSADGRTVATAGEDNRVIAWDVPRAAPRATLAGHAVGIGGLALTADGGTLYSSDVNGQTVEWDLSGRRRFGRPFGIGAPPHLITSSAFLASALGGRLLAVGHDDGSVGVIDTGTLRTVRTFSALPGSPVRALAFVPHGGPLVVGGDDGRLALFDPRRGTLLQRLRGQHGGQVRISLSADGSRMATLSGQDSFALWALRDGRVAGPPVRRYPTYVPVDLALSPDGRTLALSSPDSVELVDAATLKRVALRTTGIMLDRLGGFTADGRALIVESGEGWGQLWSARTLKPVTPPFGGQDGFGVGAAVSPDGRTLATTGANGSVRLFDLATETPVGAPMTAVANRPAEPVFSADGAYLFALTAAGVGYRWDVRPASWEARACAVAGRPLTRAEWSGLLPGRPYAPACAG